MFSLLTTTKYFHAIGFGGLFFGQKVSQHSMWCRTLWKRIAQQWNIFKNGFAKPNGTLAAIELHIGVPTTTK